MGEVVGAIEVLTKGLFCTFLVVKGKSCHFKVFAEETPFRGKVMLMLIQIRNVTQSTHEFEALRRDCNWCEKVLHGITCTNSSKDNKHQMS